MKIIANLSGGIFAILAFCILGGSAASAQKRSNILFIAVDDLNDWVGHLGGHPQANTPNIDRLATLCNPSQVSLLTGILPSNSGVYGNGELLRDKLPATQTLMQYLRKSGLISSRWWKDFSWRRQGWGSGIVGLLSSAPTRRQTGWEKTGRLAEICMGSLGTARGRRFRNV